MSSRGKKKHNRPNDRRMAQHIRGLQSSLRYLLRFVDPTFRPEDYATASTTAESIIKQLTEADSKDGGRRSVLVPTMLYDALLAGSLTLFARPDSKESVGVDNPYTRPMGEEGGM